MPTSSLSELNVGTGPRSEILTRLVTATFDTLTEVLPERLVAVYLEPQSDQLAVVRIRPRVAPPPVDGYGLELRFASWLTVLDAPRIEAIPTYLSSWLPLSKALVVPMIVRGHHRGAIVLDVARLSRGAIEPIEQIARELAGKLTELERLTPKGLEAARDRFANSVRRIKRT